MNDHTSNAETVRDSAATRKELNPSCSKRYWRSLEDLSPNQGATHGDEFAPFDDEPMTAVNRRDFLKLASATMALAGLTACTKQPTHEILPYVRQPEGLVPGEPLFYA